jgi:hypothetical protein
MTNAQLDKNPHVILSGFLRYLSFVLFIGIFFTLYFGFASLKYQAYFLLFELLLFVIFTFSSYKLIFSYRGHALSIILLLLCFFNIIAVIMISPYAWKSVSGQDFFALFISLFWFLLVFRFRSF